MKRLILSITLFFSIISITNAIPLPALAIGYDFIILLVPTIFTIFSLVFVYFRKYLFWFLLIIFFIIIILYEIHYYITKSIYYFRYELVFIVSIGILIFISKKIKVLGYIIIIPLLVSLILLIKIDYNLYEFNKIYNLMLNTDIGKKEITGVKYKDNYMVVYGIKNENGFLPYAVVENGVLYDKSYYLKKDDYYIVYGPYGNLGKNLSDLAYKVIE